MRFKDRLLSRENIVSEDKEIWAVIAFAILVFGGIVICTGSLWSGYHMLDDHHVITKTYLIQREGLFNAIVQSVEGDLTLRFRPLYWALHLIKCAIFGPNFFAWMLLVLVEGIVSYVAIYVFARNIGTGQIEAFLFSSIVFFGPQFQPWYRSSNQENAGFLFCALGLMFLTFAYKDEKISPGKRVWSKILFLFFITLATLEKESFVIFLPAYLTIIMMIIRDRDTQTPFGKLFKRELPVIIYIILLMLTELYVIVGYVGTNKIGYAGFGNDVGAIVYIKGIAKTLIYSNGIRWYVVAILASLLMCLIHKVKLFDVNIWIILSFLYIIGTQIILYARSTMIERYILPCSVGFALLLTVYCLRICSSDSRAYLTQIAIVTLLVIIGLIQSITMSRDWAKTGQDFNNMLEEVRSVIRDDEGADILVNFAADEVEGSIEDYENMYGTWNWYHAHTETFEYRYFGQQFDYIVCFFDGWYDSENTFCKETGINASDYEIVYTDPDEGYVILRNLSL